MKQLLTSYRYEEIMGKPPLFKAETSDEIIHWYEAEAIDGIIAVPGGSDISLTLFLEQVLPQLAERGLFRKEYAGSTLREYLGIDKQFKGEDE